MRLSVLNLCCWVSSPIYTAKTCLRKDAFGSPSSMKKGHEIEHASSTKCGQMKKQPNITLGTDKDTWRKAWRCVYLAVLAGVGLLHTGWGHLGRQNLNWKHVPTWLACGHTCGVFAWWLIDGGRCHPWAGENALYKKAGWASQWAVHHYSLQVLALSSCLGLPQWTIHDLRYAS